MEDKKIKWGKANQIKNAFDFLEKLYQESAFLIREVESQLNEKRHKFQLFSDGYCICSRTSIGLEAKEINSWLRKKFAVAFVEKSNADLQNEQVRCTETNENSKILYFRFILDDINQSEPQLIFGVFHDIRFYKDWVKKRGNLLVAVEYADNKLLAKFPNIDYEDDTFKLKGKLKKVNLFDINSTKKLIEEVINPIIQLYEQQD